MTISKKPYKGTRDFFPPLKRTQDFLFLKMRQTAELYGYESYNGPLLEEVDLYLSKSGEELINEQIYSFTDRGERNVAIRPEMTPTTARMVAQIHREVSRPIRWYSIPNLMRYENPQRGRLREHWQFNCDIFGAPEGQGEVEILQMAIDLLRSFGADSRHFEILVNDRKIVDETFGGLMKLPKEKVHHLYKIVDKAKKVSPEALREMVGKLDISDASAEIFYQYLELKDFQELFSFLKKYNREEASFILKNTVEKFQELQLSSYLVYDPTIVRGLDYYTGMVFEVFDKDPQNRRALCGGGTYGNLLEIFQEPPLPGVGFGLGDVTLKDFLETHKLLPDFSKPELDLYLTFQTDEGEIPCLTLARQIRQAGISVGTHFLPLKLQKVFPLAEKKGARFAGLLGGDELREQILLLKNLTTHEQWQVPFNDLEKLKEIIPTRPE